jgi:peptidoglycan/xylan/chitin deacetylase (PgdA/CDA1 family)
MSGTRVINVLFHGIGTPRRSLEPGEDQYWVEVDQFHELLDEALRWPGVRISFDDSNSSDLEYALPALQRRQVQASFFIIAGRLHGTGSLDAAGVRALRDAGMRIGSHGMHHRPWRGLAEAEAHVEVVAAREQLAEVLGGAAVEEAACPLGRYDRAVLLRLRALGYRRVFTSDRRPARDSAWLQARYSVHSDDTAHSLRAAVFGRSAVQRARAQVAGVVKRWR